MQASGKDRHDERALVLLTDGVNTAGQLDPLKAAELARAHGIRIHTIALGSSGTTLSVFGLPTGLPGGGDDIDEATVQASSVERGVGKERVCTGRTRWSQDDY